VALGKGLKSPSKIGTPSSCVAPLQGLRGISFPCHHRRTMLVKSAPEGLLNIISHGLVERDGVVTVGGAHIHVKLPVWQRKACVTTSSGSRWHNRRKGVGYIIDAVVVSLRGHKISGPSSRLSNTRGVKCVHPDAMRLAAARGGQAMAEAKDCRHHPHVAYRTANGPVVDVRLLKVLL
jgi:hypothetical protein